MWTQVQKQLKCWVTLQQVYPLRYIRVQSEALKSSGKKEKHKFFDVIFLLSPKDLVLLHILCPVRGIITKSDFTYCKMWLLVLLWASHHHTTIHKRTSRCLVHVGGVSNVPTRIINGTIIVHPFNPSEIQKLSASTNKTINTVKKDVLWPCRTCFQNRDYV